MGTIDEREARPGETIVQIGRYEEAGTACRHCGASYRTCSEDVMREFRDPKANDGCCDECRDSSGHEVRHLPSADLTRAIRLEEQGRLLRQTLGRVERIAKQHALTNRALGRQEHERNWLDVLAIIDGASEPAPESAISEPIWHDWHGDAALPAGHTLVGSCAHLNAVTACNLWQCPDCGQKADVLPAEAKP